MDRQQVHGGKSSARRAPYGSTRLVHAGASEAHRVPGSPCKHRQPQVTLCRRSSAAQERYSTFFAAYFADGLDLNDSDLLLSNGGQGQLDERGPRPRSEDQSPIGAALNEGFSGRATRGSAGSPLRLHMDGSGFPGHGAGAFHMFDLARGEDALQRQATAQTASGSQRPPALLTPRILAFVLQSWR